MTPHEEYIIENILLPRLRRISRSLDKFIMLHGAELSADAYINHTPRRELCSRCLTLGPMCYCRRWMFRDG